MFDFVFLNFFSVGLLLSSIFNFFLAYIFLASKKKTKSTYHLGIAVFFLGIFNIAYFIASSITHPIIAYHRWIAIPTVLMVMTHFILFILNFTETEINKKIPLITKILHSTTLLTTITFIVVSSFSSKYFVLNLQYWDFNAPIISLIVSIIIFFYIIIFAFFAITKIKLAPTKDKKTIIILTIIIILATTIPAILNILNRQAIINRHFFMLVWSSASLLGFSLFSIIYLNSTKDKIMLMAKMEGISLATLLIVLQVLNFYVASETNNSYKQLINTKTKLTIHTDLNKSKADYLFTYSIKDKTKEIISNTAIDLSYFNKNIEYYNQILNFNTETNKKYKLKKINDKIYISNLYINNKTSELYEVGFPYKTYKKYIHNHSLKLLFIIILLLLSIFISVKFLFKNILITPLKTLYKALETIQKGNLNTQIKIKMYDEIGIISHNVNKMVESLAKSKIEIENHSSNLKNKIEKRTSEIETTLDEMKKLNEQQAGDYFLTSLLLEPLSKNNAAGVNVNIDFYLKQKKTFKFKKWEKEIGGDICMSHNLFLKGKLYSVFINGDAMGKSIQGAGGILVLASSFQALIGRTRFSSVEQEQHPENWLKKSYEELERVFETFDGAMTISIFMGLIDDETGLMYYINAEHPWTVLYKNNKATFIEEELLLRKLGMHTNEELLKIKIRKMKPGDTIITGSDGRDDIITGYDENNNRIINENELIFLKHVEDGKGKLNNIAEKILEFGETVDDLSLISITYKENEKPKEQKSEPKIIELLNQSKEYERNKNIEKAIELLVEATNTCKHCSKILKKLLKLLINNKKYEQAIKYIDQYLDLSPEDTDFLYIASYCYMKTANFKIAGELGERAYLRNPLETKYILHLAKVLIETKDYVQADGLIDQALDIDSNNERALKLKNSM